ncbi:MAG: tRNA (adenosine(37)-N6)-threonylcarbamoyltransferase complex dimerization subunit type 1 TsaB [Clostridia bacterium]|nr:tRNA (adenosine(37)-N6)-threonylcarbamoyltransferase complex dimerization subunit type 1 TsaB [Clostridia bacterium]
MKILAVDSVGKIIEIALLKDDKKFVKNLELKMNASEFLLSLIDELLVENDLTLNDLDYLALNIGPGSFTGIRIAMSLFKGFMVSTNLKCIVVNSFDILSYNIKSNKFIVNIDSGTSGYYSMIKDNSLTTFLALEKNQLLKLSSEYQIFSDTILDNDIPFTLLQKDDNSLLDSVLFALQNNSIKNEYELEPLYVKKAQSEREYKNKFLSKITIENATTVDIDSILDLENNNFENPYTKEQILDDINQNNLLVAKENGKIYGYLSYLVSDQLEILKICVDKEKRNLGIGETLISKLSFYQKDIFLEVSDKNPAKNFYAKIGFKYLSTRKKYYADGSDAIIMVKRFQN